MIDAALMRMAERLAAVEAELERRRVEVPLKNDYVLAYHSTNQSIADSTLTAVALDSEVVDSNGLHSTVTNNSRLTIVTAGVYWIFGQMSWANNATGFRQALLRLNGSTLVAEDIVPVNSGSVQTTHNVFQKRVLAVGDYIELVAGHNSGAGLNVNGGGSQTGPYLGAFWIRSS